MDITITDKGLNELKNMDREIKTGEDIFDKLTSKEANELNRILDKIRS